MKKRLHDKKAGIAILVVLILISLVEMIFRVSIMWDATLNTSNAGEPVASILFAAFLLVMTAKGKDRICYICFGAWLGYFVLRQMFGLGGMIGTFFAAMKNSEGFTDFAIVSHIVSMITIIAIGGLLVEYMNDGTIYNKAFNVLCVVTLLTFVINILFAIYDIVVLNDISAILAIFNNLYRGAMVFMFTFFAYDSAKHQLKKVKFDN